MRISSFEKGFFRLGAVCVMLIRGEIPRAYSAGDLRPSSYLFIRRMLVHVSKPPTLSKINNDLLHFFPGLSTTIGNWKISYPAA